MKTISNDYWVYYLAEEKTPEFDADKVGKWMYFFKDAAFAKRICQETVEQGIVTESKHSNAPDGVCCFYLNCDDLPAHRRIITYFLEHDLIRRTKTGRLYNISFKLDSQTHAGEYGADFKGAIKLEQFLNLDTGEWRTNE